MNADNAPPAAPEPTPSTPASTPDLTTAPPGESYEKETSKDEASHRALEAAQRSALIQEAKDKV